MWSGQRWTVVVVLPAVVLCIRPKRGPVALGCECVSVNTHKCLPFFSDLAAWVSMGHGLGQVRRTSYKNQIVSSSWLALLRETEGLPRVGYAFSHLYPVMAPVTRR